MHESTNISTRLLAATLLTLGACASPAPPTDGTQPSGTSQSERPLAAQPVASADAAALPPAPDAPAAVPWAVAEAAAIRPIVETEVARAFLDAAAWLPAGVARTLHRDVEGRWLTDAELADVPADARSAVAVTADSYYTTKYGSPLAYARVLELLGDAGLTSLAGLRVLDFGAGSAGHLRLLALAGAHAVGVDVDGFLAALYGEAGTVGEVDRFDAPSGGSARLLIGSWPADESLRADVGEGYDVVTSKNTLKRGYIRPEQPVDARMLVHLGVDEATFLAQVQRVLVPGGLFVIENLSPAQDPSGTRYIPWADGRCPFTRDELDAAGFDVVLFDAVGDDAARALGRALGWDTAGMDLERDLFEHATVARRRAP